MDDAFVMTESCAVRYFVYNGPVKTGSVSLAILPVLCSMIAASALGLAATALLLTLCAVSLRAQATIIGVARDLQNQPLGNVEVMVVSPEQRVRSDSAGKFRIGGLAAGTYNLRSRRIGYFPVTMKLTLAEHDTVAIIVELEKRPVMLDTVRVTASCPRFEFAGFACRRRGADQSKGAFFFDVDAIDSVQPRFPIDMIRDVPGLRVVAVRGGRGLGIESTHDWMCRMVSLANGKLPSLQNPLPVWPNETIGIEVYPTGKDVPAEYSHFVRYRTANSCGLVNYWTVVRPRKR